MYVYKLYGPNTWCLIPCGGGVEYHHRSPASRRRQRKGNPMSGDITGPPCAWGIYVRGPGPPGWGGGGFKPETVKCGHESRGTRTWEWLRLRGPATIVNDRPILSSERMLHKDYDHKCSVGKKKMTGHLKGLVTKTNWLAVNGQS
jgi:hypothetical protein